LTQLTNPLIKAHCGDFAIQLKVGFEAVRS